SIFNYDDAMGRYLRATDRAAVAELADAHRAQLRSDPECHGDPERFYDEVIEIDLSALEPQVVGPHTPDLGRPISRWGEDTEKNGWPTEISAALIGSCTNSSYEDLTRAASVARQAAEHGLKAKAQFLVSPGSDRIQATIDRDGITEIFQSIGGVVLANACGPCIGQWKRDDAQGVNTIITSFNRNFKKRADGNPDTQAFIGSPEIVVAAAIAGTTKFDPQRDELVGADGERFKLEPPVGVELPEKGFASKDDGYVAPTRSGEVIVSPTSERIALLEPFGPRDPEKDFKELPILVKALGKCTTDHVSPAGPWLRFRGHLDNISNNMYIGAVNAFTGEAGKGTNVITGETGVDFNKIARDYKARGLGWVVVADENYGEGSSREHAAMEPRHLGCRAIIARSFARIAEANLKKQGILPLWFKDKADYDKFQEKDRVTIEDVAGLAPGKEVVLTVTHEDGSSDRVVCTHTLNEQQIAWFHAGSALNYLKQQQEQAASA
ncbi:MAG: aconitate hydratase, partial [Nitrospirae bacterium]